MYIYMIIIGGYYVTMDLLILFYVYEWCTIHFPPSLSPSASDMVAGLVEIGCVILGVKNCAEIPMLCYIHLEKYRDDQLNEWN